jgi:hypothetical protein
MAYCDLFCGKAVISYHSFTSFTWLFDLQSFFGFGASVDVDIVLDGQETRKTAEIKAEDGKLETHYLYYDGETISGKVSWLLGHC